MKKTKQKGPPRRFFLFYPQLFAGEMGPGVVAGVDHGAAEALLQNLTLEHLLFDGARRQQPATNQ